MGSSQSALARKGGRWGLVTEVRIGIPRSGVHPEVEVAEYLRDFPEIGVAEFGARDCGTTRLLEGNGLRFGLVQRWVEGRVAWERVFARNCVPGRGTRLGGGEAGSSARRAGGALRQGFGFGRRRRGVLPRGLDGGGTGGLGRNGWRKWEGICWNGFVESVGRGLIRNIGWWPGSAGVCEGNAAVGAGPGIGGSWRSRVGRAAACMGFYTWDEVWRP